MRTAFIRRRIHLAHARASTFHTKPQRDPSRTDLAVHTTYSLCPPYTSEKPNEVLTRDLLTKSTPHPLSPPRALVQTPAEMVTIQRGVSLNQSTNAAFQHTNQPTNQPTKRGDSTDQSTNQRGDSTNQSTNAAFQQTDQRINGAVQRTHQQTNGHTNEPTDTPTNHGHKHPKAFFGPRWCEIEKLLPGRTANSIKNRSNSSAGQRWQQYNAGNTIDRRTSYLFMEKLKATLKNVMSSRPEPSIEAKPNKVRRAWALVNRFVVDYRQWCAGLTARVDVVTCDSPL